MSNENRNIGGNGLKHPVLLNASAHEADASATSSTATAAQRRRKQASTRFEKPLESQLCQLIRREPADVAAAVAAAVAATD